MNDAIVEEVRAVREAYAGRFNYDIRKIYEDVKAREQTGNHPTGSATRRARFVPAQLASDN